MTYTYEWTSVATGKPVTLTQTIDANESCYISSTLSMVLRGTTFAADCYGSDFPLVDGYREIKLLSRPGRDTMLRAKTPDAICQQILADYRAAEQAHRDHLLTDADIRYTIHDTTSYGIYNGFNGDLINSMARHYIRQLSEEFAPLVSDEFLREVKKALNLVGEIVNDVNDERYNDEGDNVIIDGKRYYYDDLDMEW